MKNRQQGIVLPVVLVILLIMSVLGIALIGRMTFDARAEKISEDQMQAHYLARSGIEIGKIFLKQNSEIYNSQQFYFYGDLDGTDGDLDGSGGWTLINTQIPNNNTVKGKHPIVVDYSLVNNNYILTATGFYRGQTDKITFIQVLPITPVAPLDTPIVDEGLNSWVNPSSKIIIKGTHYYDPDKTSPVQFVGNKTDYKSQGSSGADLHAPQIYFVEDHESDGISTLNISKNLAIYSNFFSCFYPIYISSGNQLTLHTYDYSTFGSDLTGTYIINHWPSLKDLSGNSPMSGTTYGLVYFDRNIYYMGSAISAITPHCYYYFPTGMNVALNYNQLIKVTPDKIDFSALNISKSESGAYQ